MCQLFAFSSSNKQNINNELKSFYSASNEHPDGWGLASYKDGSLTKYIKQPIEANKSKLCEKIINNKVESDMALAHIRKATRGVLTILNTHLFMRETREKKWVFCHNGTIDCNIWNVNQFKPAGNTDSEKIFCTLLNNLPNNSNKNEDIYKSLEKTIEDLTPYGKLNLIFTDGEKLFVHCNREKKLYFMKNDDKILFATSPLDNSSNWKRVPLDVLFVYQNGKEIHKKQIKHDKNVVKEEPTKTIKSFKTKPYMRFGSF